ncbi:MAG: Fe-S cluster assembly protein SufB [Wigglesworthia glossinidia]|nr:Fe-S cluster assembly protein SufB [Wigglesworthia glossinidia]
MENKISYSSNLNKCNMHLDKYKEGFTTNLKTDELEKGINEKIVRSISKKRHEPDWMLDFRLQAYTSWIKMHEPHWLHGQFDPINYNEYSYYSAPQCDACQDNKKNKTQASSNNYLVPEVKHTFEKLGIPTKENNNIAIDAIFDSVSVSTTYQDKLKEIGIIFCSFSEAIQNHPELVRKYLGSVVPADDNFFAALNAAVASDGTFVYIPKNVKCPVDLSTYFRINSANTGQFERTILIADNYSTVSYIEGCSAPIRNSYQLHAAVVEVIILDYATVKYSTVQNWFPGNFKQGGILNFVTKRALCKGKKSKMSWTQSETGSAITWKYPSVILQGDYSIGEFFSIALTKSYQQADTGTKMIHIGKNSKSTIISKTISSGRSNNTYRGLVKIAPQAKYSRNFTQCDSMLIGKKSGAHTFPDIQVHNESSQIEHEATTSKIEEDQIFYCQQRGISTNDAISMIVNGFCKEIFSKLPLEFAIEAEKLLHINLDQSVG